MRRRRRFVSSCLAVLAGALAAAPANAQWVRLQRCVGALPCAIPFGVRYKPDPLLGAHFGQDSPSAFSGRILLGEKPAVELDEPVISLDFAEEAARRFVIAHPPPPRAATPKPTPPAAPKRN